jgi:hypothetical protein
VHRPAAAAPGPRLGDIANRSAAQIGAGLVVLFEQIGLLPDKVQWVHRHIAAELGGTLDPALDRACTAVASVIDADAVAFDRQPYHNRQHFCEVALTAHILCRLDRLGVGATQFVLLAALIHDFVHEGGVHAAFRQERASVDRVRPLLETAGLDTPQLGRMTALVLATDWSCGTGFMAAACKAHEQGILSAAVVPAEAPELAALSADPELAKLARILCEADILPSIGLGFAHAMRLQERLSREWRRPLDTIDKLAFIDIVLHRGFIGDFFRPSVEATRRALIRLPRASVQG